MRQINAKTPVEKQKVERWRQVSALVRAFWQAVQKEIRQLEPLDKIRMANGSILAIVEASPRRFVVRMAGVNRQFTLDTVPTEVAMAIADRYFGRRGGWSDVLKGAVYSVSPVAEVRRKAQFHWQSAGKDGEDVATLLHVLDD